MSIPVDGAWKKRMAISTRVRGTRLTRSVCPETLVLGSIAILDLLSTLVLMARYGAEEANPIMAYFLQYGTAAFCLGKLLFVVPPLLIAEWYRQYNERLVVGTLRFVIIAYILIYCLAFFHLNRYLF